MASWLGRVALYLAFLAALAGIIDLVLAKRRNRPAHARLFSWLVLVGVAAAVGVMQVALITHNFSLAYVAENNATFTPLLYSITGMWSALEGSLLLWVLLLGGLTVGVVWRYRREASDVVVQWATLTLFAVNAFFIFLMVGPADPFLRSPVAASQGAGPNTLLQIGRASCRERV